MQVTKKKEPRIYTRPRTPFAHKSLGEILIERELITVQQLENALKLQQGDGREIGHILVHQSLITPDDLLEANSLYLGIPTVNLRKQEAQPEAIDLIPEMVARKYNVLALEVVDGSLVLAMANPEDYQAYQDAQIVSGKRIKPVLATLDEIRQAINRNYKSSEGNGQIASDVEKLVEPEAPKKIGEDIRAADRPLDRIINQIILEAVEARASDIHIEPQKTGFV